MALVLAIVAAAVLLFVPVTSVESGEVRIDPVTGRQEEVHRRYSETLLDSEGASVIPVLVLPVVLTGLGVVAGRRSARRLFTVAVVIYGAGVLLAMASIGLFFLPSLMAIVAAQWVGGVEASRPLTVSA